MHPSEHAKRTPHKAAYIMAPSGTVVTYAELNDRSLRGARVLRHWGVNPGEHIAVFMENNHHYLQIIWAAQRSGLIVTPISSHSKVVEVKYILENSDSKVLIISAKMHSLAAQLREQAGSVAVFAMVNGAAPGYESWEEALARELPEPLGDECAGALMMYSDRKSTRLNSSH